MLLATCRGLGRLCTKFTADALNSRDIRLALLMIKMPKLLGRPMLRGASIVTFVSSS